MPKSIEAARAGSNASAVLRLTEVLCFLSLLHESEVGIFPGGQALEDSVALEPFRVRPQYKTDVSMVSATIALVSARVGRYENHCNPTLRSSLSEAKKGPRICPENWNQFLNKVGTR